jgi:hypothetical protein
VFEPDFGITILEPGVYEGKILAVEKLVLRAPQEPHNHQNHKDCSHNTHT